MAKIVNCWNEWDPLKHVVIGRPEGTNVPAPEPAWWYDLPKGGYPLGSYGPFPQEMVDAANEQMNYFIKTLEKRGIKVDRPTIHPCMFNVPVSTPDWTQLNCHGVNNVRDVFLVHGNYIVEATTCRRSRYYEYLNMRPLFVEWFKKDPEVVHFGAPKPRLTDKSYVKNYYYDFNNVWTDAQKTKRLHNWEFQLSEEEPLWDAADAWRCGKDIFHQASCVTNRGGMDWLKRTFASLEPGIRVHAVQFDTPEDPKKPNNHHPWHIDVNLAVPRPGLCVYNPDWKPRTPEFWELFKKNDWELIPAARPTYVHKNLVYLTDLYESKSWISVNTFSVAPNVMCVEAHETAFIEQLTKLGVEVIPIPYEKVIPFGGALHCTTLDIYREGKCEDYFPKQVKGY